MKINVYSILDSAVESFNQPFYARSRAEAVRMFREACKTDKSFIANPRDYTLFEVGGFDDASGALTAPNAPIRVISAAEAIQALREAQSDPEPGRGL